jgi:hypothetical protein
MAAVGKISLRAKLEDLGIPVEIVEQFTTVPTEAQYNYIVQTTTNTAQVLNLGGVATIQAIIILAKSKNLAVDTSWVTPTFVEEITIAEGQFAVFVPGGTVYVKNSVAGEVATFEYLVIGA